MANMIKLTVFMLGCSVALGALIAVDDFSRSTLDNLVRKKLMFMVLNQANDTIKMQTTLKTQCSVKINQTLAQCKACAARNTQQQAPPSGSVWEEVLPVMLLPLATTGGMVKDIEGSVVDAVHIMGHEAKHFVNDVGSVAKHTGQSLIDGTKDIGNSAVSGLKQLGNNIGDLASDLGHGLEHTVHEISSGTLNLGSGIGHSLESLGSSLSHGAANALDGIKDLGHQIEHVGSSAGHALGSAVHSVGHALGHIFGRRRAFRRSVCISCDKINTKTKDAHTILTEVCGADSVRQQNELTAAITKMKTVYDSAVKHEVISKIEYDPASMDVTNGVSFQTLYVTYVLGGNSIRYRSSSWYRLTDMPTTANALAEEIFSR